MDQITKISEDTELFMALTDLLLELKAHGESLMSIREQTRAGQYRSEYARRMSFVLPGLFPPVWPAPEVKS